MNKRINERRFVTTTEQAKEVENDQRQMTIFATRMQDAKPEKQRVERTNTIDLGIFNVVDQAAFENAWRNTKC